MPKSVSDLSAHPGNPRSITEKKLAQLGRTMSEFGDLSGVVFNQTTGHLVGGTQRSKNFDASSKLVITKKYDRPTRTGTVAEGYILAPNGERWTYREVAWDPNREKAASIAANQGAGVWDLPKLENWLKELGSFDVDFDLDLTGLDDIELKEFAGITVSEHQRKSKTGVDEDDVPEKAPPRTKSGDIYRLGAHRLMCGDSTDAKTVGRLFREMRADVCFTSPPYSDQRVYNGKTDLSCERLALFMSAAKEVCPFFCVNLGYARKDGEVAPYWNAYIDQACSAGLKFLSWNVWNKGEAGSIGTMTAPFALSHEWIFVFGCTVLSINKTKPNKHAGVKTHGSKCRSADGTLLPATGTVVARFGKMLSVSSISPLKSRKEKVGHPAMFPVALPEQYIEAMTGTGGTVYDPFGGGGTTMIACEKLDRRCFMMEIDPGYCDVIVERWEKYTGKKAKLVHSAKSPETKLRKKSVAQLGGSSHAGT